MRKKDHDDGTHFRSKDRVFCMNGEWFFETREDDHGPYATREAAEVDLSRYIDEMSYLDGADKPPAPAMAKSTGKLADLKTSDLQLVDKDEPPTTH
ncbi:MAG: DUF6316 family protein [Gammaproteobacteria bacterium]|nr:DUF6316 family protein [Gammaproteobacteria bacterium]